MTKIPTIKVALFSIQYWINAADDIATERATKVKSTGNPKAISPNTEGVLFLLTMKLRKIALSSTRSAGSINASTYHSP